MTDTTPEAVAGMVEALQIHAHDDCGGQDVPTHIGNLAAAMLSALSAEVERLKLTEAGNRITIADLAGARDQAREVLAEAERLMKDPVAVHVNMLRGSVARLSPSQVWHIYGAALADAMPSDVRKDFLAKHT